MTPKIFRSYAYTTATIIAALAFVGVGLWKNNLELALVGMAIFAPAPVSKTNGTK